MIEAQVVGIFIAPQGAAPMQSLQHVRAMADRGLEGDRYFLGTGTFFKPGKTRPSSQAQVTLIEAEAIEAIAHENGIELAPGDSRRNIITRGVALNHLVGREFIIVGSPALRAGRTQGSPNSDTLSASPVRLRGIKLCEPCKHLESLTQNGVRSALIHRGGLRAQILSDGTITIGDRIKMGRE